MTAQFDMKWGKPKREVIRSHSKSIWALYITIKYDSYVADIYLRTTLEIAICQVKIIIIVYVLHETLLTLEGR